MFVNEFGLIYILTSAAVNLTVTCEALGTLRLEDFFFPISMRVKVSSIWVPQQISVCPIML